MNPPFYFAASIWVLLFGSDRTSPATEPKPAAPVGEGYRLTASLFNGNRAECFGNRGKATAYPIIADMQIASTLAVAKEPSTRAQADAVADEFEPRVPETAIERPGDPR